MNENTFYTGSKKIEIVQRKRGLWYMYVNEVYQASLPSRAAALRAVQAVKA